MALGAGLAGLESWEAPAPEGPDDAWGDALPSAASSEEASSGGGAVVERDARQAPVGAVRRRSPAPEAEQRRGHGTGGTHG